MGIFISFEVSTCTSNLECLVSMYASGKDHNGFLVRRSMLLLLPGSKVGLSSTVQCCLRDELVQSGFEDCWQLRSCDRCSVMSWIVGGQCYWILQGNATDL